MILRDADIQLLPKEGNAADALQADSLRQNSHLTDSLRHMGPDLGHLLQGGGDGHAGKAAGKSGEEGPEGSRRAGLHCDGVKPLVKLPDLAQDVFRLRQQMLCPLRRLPSRLIELDSIFPPHKKRHAEHLFQVLHSPGQGGLRNVQLFRRL